MNILIHGTVIGLGGIAHQTREFSKSLLNYHNVKIRNFNIDHDVWNGYDGPNVFRDIKELEPIHHKMLYQQTLWEDEKLKDFQLSGYDDSFVPDIHIIMTEANHHYHFQNYNKPVIAYFLWETTKLHQNFLNVLKGFDAIWSPTGWQKQVLIESGINKDKICVVNAGVDPEKFYPIKKEKSDRLKILHIGPWDYRKSTYEIVKTFLKLFKDNNDVELRLSIHSKINSEYDTPENIFKKYGLQQSKNIVFLETLSEDEYINEIQNTDLYLSCSRGEGWNFPLIQSLSCGIPSIYSKCSGQLEFTNGFTGIGIDIVGQYPATKKIDINNVTWGWDVFGDYPGDLYEPNYEQLEKELFKFYHQYKEKKDLFPSEKGLNTSKFIHKKYNWDTISQKASEILKKYENNGIKLPAFLTDAISIGDFISCTPTIKKIAKTYRTKVLVISSNPDLLKNNPYVSESIHIDSIDVSLIEKDYDVHRSYHLLGKRDSLGIEFKHAMCDIRQFHAKDLGFMLTPNELSCDYYPDDEESCMKGIDLPERYVVIHPTQTWDSRTWDVEKWQTLCDELAKERIFIVAIGKNSGEYSLQLQQDKPVFDLDIKYGIDLTNKTTLDQSWHIMNRAQIVVTMDSGILHLAGTTDTYIIQLGSSIDPYYRAPYRKGSQKYKYKYVLGSCRIHCASDLSYSLRDWHSIQSVTLINTCLENKKEFECKPGPLTVLKEVVDVFNGKNEESELDYFYEIPTEVLDLRSAGLNLLKFDVDVDISFRYGPKVVINGDEKDPRVFNVNFIDDNNQEILHESSIRVNHWTKASIKYYTKWRIVVSHLEEIIHEEVVDLSGKNVMVSLYNTALGDSVAWLPYCEEFRKLHDCILTVETPHHKIFSKSYPEIEWVPFGDYTQEDDKFYGWYQIAYGPNNWEDHKEEINTINRNFRIGKGPLFSSKLSIWDKHKIPRDPHTITLAEIATDALGMKFREIRPNLINPRPNERPYDQKFVCISEFASAPGLKEWNNKIGWEKVVDKLTSLGFKVVSISKEKSNLKNVIKRNGGIDLAERIWYLHNCEFFIGVSSGLSWLAWACGKKVVMISGATLEFNEFQEDNIRIINKEGCHGCWNSEEHRHKFACFHSSLCPEDKNFECTRKISPNLVIDRMQEAGLIRNI